MLVYTHPSHQRTWRETEERGYLGVTEGATHYRVNLEVTSDPEEACNFSRIIAMSVRGDVRDDIWQQFRNIDLSEHVILFIPGFREEANAPEYIKFGAVFQTTSTPVTAQPHEDGIAIVGRKDRLPICGSDKASRTLIKELLGCKVRWTFNEFDLATQNGNGIVHPPIVMGNVERIKCGEDFRFYKDGMTAEVISTMLEISAELCEGRRMLNYDEIALMDIFNELYPFDFQSLEDFRDRSPVHAGRPAPKTLETRELFEDVPVHYVFWYEMLCVLGIPAPALEREICKACELTGWNFFEEGAHLKRGGLNGLTREELIGRFGRPKAESMARL